MDIEISVLIPMYNAGKYIQEAVKSVVAQGLRNYELIIVDDGSEDDSFNCACDVLKEIYSDRDFRNSSGCCVSLIRMPHRGQAAARNTALSYAKGRWIFYLDADDVLTEGAVTALLSAADDHKDSSVICSCCEDFISPELSEDEAFRLKANTEPYRRMLAGCLLIRREVFETVGNYDESLSSSETAQWMLRMQDSHEFAVHNIDYVTLRRRYHLNNFGRRAKQTQLDSYMAIIRQRISSRKAEKE